ncbi:MAG: maltokinase N-terminal cap-like domain-containing protein [Marmoricola sp.]
MREQAVRDYIGQARWFGGKGTEITIGEVRELPLGILLVEVGSDLYQLPTSSYDEEQPALEHALIGQWDDRFHYDAVHDRSAMATWLDAFVDGAPPPLRFSRMPGHELDRAAVSTPFSGEQSNSSVMFGEDSMLKVFRRVTAGPNPDIEIHRALTAAGSEHIAQLYGWIELDGPDGPIHLGMLQQFLRTAIEGWSVARASVRNLLAEADLHPDEVGGDFAPEAHRLGAAVAEVHSTLREALGTEPLDLDEVAARMHARLDRAAAEVPELAPFVDTPREAFERMTKVAADLEARASSAQRIHGDLHLGQTLRTSLGWKLVDFEGEPAKPLAERTLADSPWRDVAGMLRSLDYAAKSAARDLDPDEAALRQAEYRGGEWVARNREAFLAGYAEATAPLSEVDLALIAAYELDKAVYEVMYEARNRPGWLAIPLAALAKAGEDR